MITFGGNTLTVDGAWLTEVDPLNPLGLPPYTLRCRFTSGYTPTQGTSRVQVSSSPNVWDITKDTPDEIHGGVTWGGLFYNYGQGTGCTQLLEVLGANATGVVFMQMVFHGCSNLTSVAPFDASSTVSCWGMFHENTRLVNAPGLSLDSCYTVGSMFYQCSSLVNPPNLTNTSGIVDWGSTFSRCSSLGRVPLYGTSSAEYIGTMFSGCRNVASGAYELYQQVSQQPTVRSYGDMFTNCGIDTVTGLADLQRIPTSYGGLME